MIEIPRGPDDDGWQKVPLTWRLVKYADGHLGATVSCDKGHSCVLTNHDIASDGVVTPSLVCPIGLKAAEENKSNLVCPEPECGWHENVRLLDWKP